MISNNILLKLINRSNDQNDSKVIIFQENLAENFRPETVIWKVISDVERDDHFYFEYSPIIELSMDSSMNFSMGGMQQLTEAEPGMAYEVVDDISGQMIQLSERWVGNPNHVEIYNEHPGGVFDANCYRNGKLLASKKALMNNGMAAFHFSQSLHFCVLSDMEDIEHVVEGGEIGTYHLLSASTQLTFGHITDADIVMTGGGTEPFKFTLENAKFFDIEV